LRKENKLSNFNFDSDLSSKSAKLIIKFKNPKTIYYHNKPNLQTFSKGAPILKRKREAFENILLEAVDEALASLGDSAKQAIYYHLEDKFKITKNEIPKRLKDFEDGLEKIFGLGARFIEILIMKKLYEKIGKPLEWNESKELIFFDYVTAAKQSFQKRKFRQQKTASSQFRFRVHK
jgi:hypothetical protein